MSADDAGAGHDARWPLRAYPVARLLSSGPRLRDDLSRLAEALGHARRTVVEDLLCAMENDKIVEAAPVPHLSIAERRRQLTEARSAEPAGGALRLTAKGRRFLFTHDQDAEAGTCSCLWCADLAEIRKWAAETPLEEQRGLLLRLAPGDSLR